MTDFHKFASLVHAKFEAMSAGTLFVAGNNGRDVSDKYLAAFPEGTNPIFKTNTEHDCSCCKQFIRNIGNLVTVHGNKTETVWNVYGVPYPYNIVAEQLDAFVRSLPITSLFKGEEQQYGAEITRSLNEDGSVKLWNHFHAKLDGRHYGGSQVGTMTGHYNTTRDLFKRGLDELQQSALQDVRDLIEGGNLYRGEEHMVALLEFMKLKQEYTAIFHERERDNFTWANAVSNYARFKNTVIGTLVADLSSGVELEAAVRMFESKVAPTNYKRTSALITPKMVQAAVSRLDALGLSAATERRFATIADVTVNNVLWVDNAVKSTMKPSLTDLLMPATKPSKRQPNLVAGIHIEEFIRTLLPVAESVVVYPENHHKGNLVSLTAPVHDGVHGLFKWDNAFAWSYAGNVTDSIKERVKQAGGNVTNAKLRISLAWFNGDDLDIHVTEPNGNHIYFGRKDGKLDVDMNAFQVHSRTPVENVSFVSTMDGDYHVTVNQFCMRETTDVGFVVEVESEGKISQFSYPKRVVGRIPVLKLTVRDGKVEEFKPAAGVSGTNISQEMWGIHTEKPVKLSTVILSPNYWDNNAVGNKHWFFILEGCRNPDKTRGIYNEFLNGKLEEHRKVFEVLGDKTMCPVSEHQLSGLGFSSTLRSSLTVGVKADMSEQMYTIQF